MSSSEEVDGWLIEGSVETERVREHLADPARPMALQFLLLGSFEAIRDHQPIPREAFRTRQTRAVLKLLVTEHDRPIPFVRLADLVWPEIDPATARNSLQAAVRTIRRVLEPRLVQGRASRFIVTYGDAYRFVADDCEIDVDEFLAARGAGIAAERRADAGAAIDAYRVALGLYRGEYLGEDSHADWSLATRERLREAHLDLVERLAALLATNGRPAEAVDVVERGLQADPLRESLYLRLMSIHAQTGHVAHVLAAYERGRRVLRTELGTEPSSALVRHRDAILARRATPADSETPIHRPQATLPLSFVGRVNELTVLREAWRRSGPEAGHFVLLTGDAGIGKTRLVRQFAELLGPAAHVLWLAAHEIEAGLSFAPLLGLLSECPELASTSPEESQLLEALTAALLARKGHGRGLVVLDDAQWADDRTLRWLAYALRRFPPGVLVVVVMRSGEQRSRALERLRSHARRSDRATSLELGPLTPFEVERLVAEATAGVTRASEFARRLHAATLGNPLFVVEVLRDVRAGATPDAAISGIPEGIRDAIVARIERLTSPARDILRAMAVIGVPATATLIASVTRRRPDPVFDALDVLLERQLVRVSDGGQGYAIDHPLLQRVAYETMGPARRQALHGRTAAALGALRGGRPGGAARQVLRHLIASGAAAAEIVDVAEAAGADALRRHAYAEAVECLETARDGLAALASDDPARGWRCLERLGEALSGAGRPADALRCYAELLDAADDPLTRARLRRRMASLEYENRADAALRLLDDAERELGERDDPDARIERGRIAGARSVPYLWRSEYSQAVASGERALALWRNSPGLERDVMEQCIRSGAAEQRGGQLEAAERRYRKALAHARALSDVLAEARCRESLALVLHLRGQLAKALAEHEPVLRTYREIGVPRFEMIGLVNRGWLHTDRGELSTARVAYEDAIERAEALDLTYWIMHGLVGLGGVQARLGDVRLARRSLRRGIALAEEIGNRQRKAHALVYLGELTLGEDDPAGARDWADRAIALGSEIGDSHTLREAHPILSAALLALGDPAGAADAARRGIECGRGFRLSEARNRLALGRARWALGDRTGAATDLRYAEGVFRNCGARYDLAAALLALATTVPAGRARGVAARAESLELASAAQARPLVMRIRTADAVVASHRAG